METRVPPRGQTLRIELPKPEGGYCIVSSHALLAAWTAYRREIIRLLDLRVWFACLELLARRCGAKSGCRPQYRFAELQDLLKNGSERSVRESLSRLERAGLVRWTERELWVARRASEFTDLNPLNGTVASDRPVPIPRRTVRYLAAMSRPVLIATTVGHLIRGLYLRGGVCVSGGRCKASWIADVFGVDARNVKAARRELTQHGWLAIVASSQTAMNRWGQAFLVNLKWCSNESSIRRDAPPPQPAIDAETPPPGVNKKLLIGSGTQKPAQRRAPGACAGEVAARRLRFRNVTSMDLQRPMRTARLFADAVQSGHLKNVPSDRLLVFAAAEHAKVYGVRNPCGLFVWLVRERRWTHINQRDEDRARATLRAVEQRSMPSECSQKSVSGIGNGSASSPARRAEPEAARQVFAGTGSAAYSILASVSAALSVRGSAQTPQPTESLQGKRRWMGPTRELAAYTLGLSKGVV